VCGVANIHRVEICCIDSRGTTGEFVSISQVIFTPIVVFIEKIRPHPTSPEPRLDGLDESARFTLLNNFFILYNT
jgi:hypothetical protein